MSRNQRLGLVAATIAVAVAAFVIAKPGGDDDNPSAVNRGEQQSSKPKVTRITIEGGRVQGEPKSISVEKGDPVRIVVSSDAPNKLHLHGFDIDKTAMPGKPARFSFKANIEGEFELESHTAEDAGQEPLVARVLVEPS
jgi:heme/copper-type cytochrome/quinol oxidase subunit 2